MSQLYPSTQLKPWEQKQISPLALLGVHVGIIFCFIIVFGSWVITLVLGIYLSRKSPQIFNEINDIIGFGVFFALALASTIGLIFLFQFSRREVNFTPSYGQIPVTSQGLPIEVRFQRYPWGRSFRGSGIAQFSPDGLNVSGNIEPNTLFQLGMVIAITILPLLFFGFGFGIIPALLISHYIGRKQLTKIIPYMAMHDLEVNGSKVIIRTSELPKRIIFSVSASDGERLYRELKQHFPQAMQHWQG